MSAMEEHICNCCEFLTCREMPKTKKKFFVCKKSGFVLYARGDDLPEHMIAQSWCQITKEKQA